MDAERLLGALLTRGMSGKRRRRRKRGRRGMLSSLAGNAGGRPIAGAVGMGALGVAIAAFEHFSQRPSQPPTQPPPGRPAPPPPPPGTGPPPVPPSRPAAPPPPPPGPADTAETTGQTDALVLIRAMIVAAGADGEVDADERQRILGELEAAGLDGEERAFVERELSSPPTIDQVVAAAGSPELRRQVYAASLAAIDVDTASERGYLQMLAHRLGLADDEVASLHNQFDIED